MSVFSGTEIVNDNCVYYHDMGNTQKSWKGAPTTNLATTQTLVNHSLVTLPTFSDAPERGEGWKKAIVTATSTNFRMLKMDAFNVGANTTHTYSIEFECNSPEVYLNIDGTGFGGGAWTKIGTTRYSRTVTTATAGAAYLFVNSNNLSASVNYVIYYKEHQIEANSFATPFVASARSTTQAILDLTNTNTVTATSLTYASDNTFSFDGTNNYLTVANNSNLAIVGDMTIIAWVKVTNFSTYNGICSKTSGALAAPWDYYLGITSGIPQFYRGNGSVYANLAATAAPATGIWQQITVTMSGTTVTHYLNGNTNGSGTLTTTIADTGNPMYIGTRQDLVTKMIGQLPIVNVYNRALSAAEVAQNFNALRSRYAL